MAQATKAPSTAQVWPLIHEQRHKVADMLGSLVAEQWEAPSLCAAWRVRDVAAHCIETNLMTPGRFIAQMLGTGFRFHAMSARGVDRHRTEPVSDLLKQFRDTMDRTTAPPGPTVAMLAEAVIHGEDMARPSGRRIDVNPETLRVAADFTRNATPLLHGKQRSAGLRLRASDIEWSAGDGPEVSGPAVSLILAMAGRGIALSELSGEGLDTLRART